MIGSCCPTAASIWMAAWSYGARVSARTRPVGLSALPFFGGRSFVETYFSYQE